MRSLCCLCGLLVACGRLQFDPLSDDACTEQPFTTAAASQKPLALLATDRELALVWEEGSLTEPMTMYLSILEHDGAHRATTTLASGFVLNGLGALGSVGLAWSGTEIGLAYNHDDGTGFRSYFATYTRDGAQTAAPLALPIEGDAADGVAFRDDEFAIVRWHRDSETSTNETRFARLAQGALVADELIDMGS